MHCVLLSHTEPDAREGFPGPARRWKPGFPRPARRWKPGLLRLEISAAWKPGPVRLEISVRGIPDPRELSVADRDWGIAEPYIVHTAIRIMHGLPAYIRRVNKTYRDKPRITTLRVADKLKGQ